MADERVLPTREEREARLPLWARRELEVLRRNLARAEAAVEELGKELGAVVEESDTVAEMSYGQEWGLGKGSRVNFYLEAPDARGFRRGVTVRVEGTRIHINGYEALVIYPNVSNDMTIGFRR